MRRVIFVFRRLGRTTRGLVSHSRAQVKLTLRVCARVREPPLPRVHRLPRSNSAKVHREPRNPISYARQRDTNLGKLSLIDPHGRRVKREIASTLSSRETSRRARHLPGAFGFISRARDGGVVPEDTAESALTKMRSTFQRVRCSHLPALTGCMYIRLNFPEKNRGGLPDTMLRKCVFITEKLQRCRRE